MKERTDYNPLIETLRAMAVAPAADDAEFERKHPRGGDPKNSGRFSSAFGSVLSSLRSMFGSKEADGGKGKPNAPAATEAPPPIKKEPVVWAKTESQLRLEETQKRRAAQPDTRKKSGSRDLLFGDLTKEQLAEGRKRRKAEMERMKAEAPIVKDRWGRETKSLTNKEGEGTSTWRQTHHEDFWRKILKEQGGQSYHEIASETEAEYKAVVESGDEEKAQEMLLDIAEKIPTFKEALSRGRGSNAFLPYLSASEKEQEMEFTAKHGEFAPWYNFEKALSAPSLKRETVLAMNFGWQKNCPEDWEKKIVPQFVNELVPLLPKNSVIVPVLGTPEMSYSNLKVAETISRMTGAPVVNGLTKGDKGMKFVGELPKGKRVILLSLAMTDGNKERSAREAVGGGVVLTYMNGILTDEFNPGYQAKDVSGIRKRNGKVIPLSRRFDLFGLDSYE